MKKARAFTLFETVIAVGLLSLLVMLCANIGLPAVRSWIRASQRSDAQRSALLALIRVRDEFPYAFPPSIAVAGSQVSFLSRLDANSTPRALPTGEPAWQEWVCYRIDSTTGILYCNRNPLPGRLSGG